MPLYEYRDKQTDESTIVSTQADKQYMDSLVQRGTHRRIFSFTTARPFTAINPDDPRADPISSRTSYRDTLSRLSEEHSSRFGMDVNYQPVDLRDPSAVGVSEAGVEEAARKGRIAT